MKFKTKLVNQKKNFVFKIFFHKSYIFYNKIARILYYANIFYPVFPWGRDISVSSANLNGLGGLGIETQCHRDFPHLSRPELGSTQPPIQWITGHFRA